MVDQRTHRGPHPSDERLFAPDAWPTLQQATRDLCWLFSRGYADKSALKLVGDRHSLNQRQRGAVNRCACSDAEREERKGRQVKLDELQGEELWLDGYNVITSIEAALAGGMILHASDGCFRDMASIHGTYRKVQETLPALWLLGEAILDLGVSRCVWYLDRPVSNSGRLKGLMQDVAAEAGWPWRVELVGDPDAVLAKTDRIVATADSEVLNHVQRWVNLVREIIETRVPAARIIDLSSKA